MLIKRELNGTPYISYHPHEMSYGMEKEDAAQYADCGDKRNVECLKLNAILVVGLPRLHQPHKCTHRYHYSLYIQSHDNQRIDKGEKYC